MLDWVFRLSTHVGEYGSGAQGFVNVTQYWVNWQIILGKCGLSVLFALVAIFFTLGSVFRKIAAGGKPYFFSPQFFVYWSNLLS